MLNTEDMLSKQSKQSKQSEQHNEHIKALESENIRFKEYFSKEILLESRELYHTIFNNSLDGIIITIPGGTIISANPAACHMFGRTEKELCAVRLDEIFDMDDPRAVKALKEIKKEGSISAGMTLLRKDGTKFYGEITSKLFKHGNGQILCSVIVRDITECKKTEEALHLSDNKFYKTFYFNQTAMGVRRLKDGVYMDVNNSFAKAFGYKREEMIGKSVIELGVWADLKHKQEMEKQLLDNGYISNHEYKFRRRSGETGYMVSTITLIDIEGEKCILSSSIDITEIKKAAKDLRLSKELFYKTFTYNPLLMAISIKNGMLIEVNETFVKRCGYTREELIGCSVTDIHLWDINERLKYINEIEKNGFVENFETRYYTKSGEPLNVLLSGVTITWNNERCILTIANDITELRRYQNEIARLDRLNLVGEMAAGIGHEIRNPMTLVRGFLQLLGEKDRYAQDKEYMDLMIDELDRANSIITEYLSLAKNKTVELKRQDLNQKIRRILPLLQADAMKQNINIEVKLGDIPFILIDRNEIKQLILNLVRNGLEAMSPGGLLSIKTFKDDDSVVLAVQDQGAGIAPEVLEKIGTPFFTTKDNGTGLGLAVCYSIAQRNNAQIDFETGSTGTTFYVRFKT